MFNFCSSIPITWVQSSAFKFIFLQKNHKWGETDRQRANFAMICFYHSYTPNIYLHTYKIPIHFPGSQTTEKPLSIVPVYIVFPQVSFIFSGPGTNAHINNVQLYWMHHSLKCHFPASIIQNSWSWLTIFMEWLFLRKTVKLNWFFWNV
jgi:hypothetical protein